MPEDEPVLPEPVTPKPSGVSAIIGFIVALIVVAVLIALRFYYNHHMPVPATNTVSLQIR